MARFVCKVCGESQFADASEFDHHKKTCNKGNYDFSHGWLSCEMCGAPAISQIELDEHKQTSHRPTSPQLCGAPDVTQEEMDVHIDTASCSNVDEFRQQWKQCKYCGIVFLNVDELKDHQLIHEQLYPALLQVKELFLLFISLKKIYISHMSLRVSG